jgi:beta-1,4-mannosyl-glycoprotein beta-1,4-N-acetylglucosaminyltransferase
VHVLLDNFPANKASLSDAGDDGGRAVEHLLRNHLSDFGLRQRLTGTRNDDIFLLTDADEIPAREAVLFLKLHDGYPEPVGLHLQVE